MSGRSPQKKIIITALLLVFGVSVCAGGLFLTQFTRQTAIQMEYLDRGTAAVLTEDGVFLSWRLLGTEAYDTVFQVYKNGACAASVSDSTNYLDPEGKPEDSYQVVPQGEEPGTEKEIRPLAEPFIRIPLEPPDGAASPEETPCTYTANDAACADLDGDGEYEIILKWDPDNSFDSAIDSDGSGNVYIDAYKLDGKRLWRIDLGKNIAAGAHFTQMAAYDFDLDGKAELICKTAPGSLDGTGKYVSEASGSSEIRETDNLADYRRGPSGERTGGKILSGDEYLTVFRGTDGQAVDTVYYPFPRGAVGEWGDNVGNRAERYLCAVAYLDGVHPEAVMWRGYYGKTTAAAFRLADGKLVRTCAFDSTQYADRRYDGQGNHNLAVGDVDGDGKDEILCGSLALDHDLTPLWCSGRGHGDALHLADYDPVHPGMEYFSVHETEPCGMTLYDAATGKELFHQDSDSDTGRGMMANAGYTDGYFELWGAGSFASYGGKDVREADYAYDSANFRIFWDGDLYDELLDGVDETGDCAVKISGSSGILEVFPDIRTNNGTKNNVCLTADLFGDWREEFAARSADGTALLVFTTVIPTKHRLYTLMHDRAYRMQTASQNAGYNQPPHIGYYISEIPDQRDQREKACRITTEHEGMIYSR